MGRSRSKRGPDPGKGKREKGVRTIREVLFPGNANGGGLARRPGSSPDGVLGVDYLLWRQALSVKLVPFSAAFAC